MSTPHSCNVYIDHYPRDEVPDPRETGGSFPWRETQLHVPHVDPASEAWQALLALIDQAAAERWDTFRPAKHLGWELWGQIETLPREIARLTSVTTLNLYGSRLLSIPPEIGAMSALTEFSPYTSYGLHWFPYEITRCAQLKESTVSTRALFGNYKFRPPFPRLHRGTRIEALMPRTCSVCDGPLDAGSAVQAWISLRVATDVLPLLVHACSLGCVHALPTPAEGYVQVAHAGGLGVEQPESEMEVGLRRRTERG